MAAMAKKGTKGRPPQLKPGNMHKGLPGEGGETMFSASLKRKLAEALPWERGGYVLFQSVRVHELGVCVVSCKQMYLNMHVFKRAHTHIDTHK